MRIAVALVYPNIGSPVYDNCVRRFVSKYIEHPPGETDHEFYVLVNGGREITRQQENLFSPLVPKFLYHNNSGRDIGAYQMAARTIPCDLLVCIGAPARPRYSCWLDIMARAVEDHGPGLYGPWGFHVPAIHIRTTVFAISPQILNGYPMLVGNEQRYLFEHGAESIALWAMRKGFVAMQVTARGVFPMPQWHHVENQDSLFCDQHSDSIGHTD